MAAVNPAMADRAARVARLRAGMPQAMRDRQQWLLWKLEEVPGRNGLQKVPYYASGAKRQGDLGGPVDRAALASFDDVLARFAGAMHFTGVGFAFLEGDGLVGIDLDWKETADGMPMPHQEQILKAVDSFTETSPSGKGVHIIVAGQVDSFKHDPVGVEVYCGGRYFTCTGERWATKAEEVKPLEPFALAYMQQVVQASKDAARAAKQGQQQGAAAPLAPQRAAPASQAGNDFQRVNEAAYQQLAAWVNELFPKARQYGQAWRVRSKDLGRELEEDLQLDAKVIYDYGEELAMSPIDCVMKWGHAATPKDALHWLAPRVGVALTPPARRLSLVQPEPDIGPDPPVEGYAESPPPPLSESEAAAAPPGKPPEGDGDGGAGGKRGRGRAPKGGGGVVERLLKHYALVRGTDQVWDGEMRTTMAVKNLRLLYGTAMVNLWLAHPERRLLLAEQIKFEPGVNLPDDQVNLFDGLPTKPVACTDDEVAPMLDLLHHLCSLSADTAKGVQAVYDQVLSWCALIVQQPGAKVRFALVFHGPQGTGKNLFWDGFRRILGKYGKMVGQTELEDRFNGYMSGKLLLIGNEVVTRAELFHNKNKLKWVITEDEIPIRGMHQEVRWESNHANVVFLSNELQPVALEKDDRRHLVIYTPAAEDPGLYLRVAEFLRNDGHGKFLDYLLRVPLGDFNEFTKPLMTGAKEKLIDLGLKPAERFADEWLGAFLDLPVHPCSNGQLYTAFRRWAELNGERYPPPQATFTRTVERHVAEHVERDEQGRRLPPRLIYKQINLKEELGPRKTVRCWLPRGTGPLNGVTEGEWAAACINNFDAKLAAFGRRAGAPE